MLMPLVTPPDVKFQDQFRKSERKARSQNKGLWSACLSPTPVPTKKPAKTSLPTTSTKTKTINRQSSSGYACDCSKTCSRMASCEEAYYQLNTCGCSKRDGDGDGIPCEKICR